MTGGRIVRVLLVDNDAERAAAVRDGLLVEGCAVVEIVSHPVDLVHHVRRARADVIVCDIDSPSRDALESMHALNRDEPRPVVMFVDRSDADSIARAMQAGVAAYVIEGLVPRRVKAVVDVAVARFQAHQSLRTELEEMRTALEGRKLIDRAKAALMRSRQLSEPEAYRALQRAAMNRGQKLTDAAAAILRDQKCP